MDILPTTLCGIPPRDNLTHRYPSHGYRPHGHPFPHGHSTHGHPSPWKSVPLMLLPWANLPHEHPFPKDTLPHRCSSYGHLFPTATHPQRHLTEPAWFTWVLCHSSHLSPLNPPICGIIFPFPSEPVCQQRAPQPHAQRYITNTRGSSTLGLPHPTAVSSAGETRDPMCGGIDGLLIIHH